MTTENIDNILTLAAYQKLAANEDPVTEDAAALAFAERYRDTLRFNHDIGKWFVWTGTRWQCERTGLAFAWARELARELARAQPNKVRLTSSKTTFASGVERFARTDRAFAVTSEIWDQNSYLLGTPAGVVDLRTGLLQTPVPEDFITKLTAVAPACTFACPRWQQFLKEATNDDQALIDFLQQFVGYMLTGDTTEHSLLFIHGGGGNGKTVFQNTCGGILGDYAKVAAMETFVASGADKHPTDVAMLHGARLVTASETEEGRAWAESRIKQLTGGDKISARFMRQDFFEFTPQFKLMLIGNHQPTLRNVDDATRRRFNIVPFIHSPLIPTATSKRSSVRNGRGILRWMIDGCLLWQRFGLVRPKVVLDATEEYFAGQDSIQQWIADRCETGKGTLSDTSSNLFRSWTAWANANGEKPGTSKWFAQALRRQGFKQYRTNKARGFFGIEAKAEQIQPHWADQ